MTEGSVPFPNDGQTAAVVRHPSASLYDDLVWAIIPAIDVFAVRKNVAVAVHEYEPLARHALAHVSRKTMRRILAGHSAAIRSVQLAIIHSLDVLAAMRMMGALEAVQGKPDEATLFARAEMAMKNPFANDKARRLSCGPTSPRS